MAGEIFGLAPAHSSSEALKPRIGPKPFHSCPFPLGCLYISFMILVDFNSSTEGFRRQLGWP